MLPDCSKFWIRLPRHKWPKSWANIEDPVVPLERNLYVHPLAGLLWKDNSEKLCENLDGRKYRIGNVCLFIENKCYSCQKMWMTSKRLERSRIWLPCGKRRRKMWIVTNPHHFLTMYALDVLSVNVNRMKQLMNNTRRCLISAGATEKLPGKNSRKHGCMVPGYERTRSEMR